jgi:hypothetical protein
VEVVWLRSITWDQGTEMAHHLAITESLGAGLLLRLPLTVAERLERKAVSLVVARLGWSGRLVPAA